MILEKVANFAILASLCLFTYDLNHMLPKPFDQLGPTALKTLFRKKGEYLFRQGDRTQGAYYVQSGQATLSRVTQAGELVTLHSARKGDTFAEASIYVPHYHCDALCHEEGIFIRISSLAIINAQRANLAFSAALTQRLARQVVEYRQLVTVMGIKSAQERVFTAIKTGVMHGTITQFATQIGLSREACYRALSALYQEGRLVKVKRGHYHVVNGSAHTSEERFSQ